MTHMLGNIWQWWMAAGTFHGLWLFNLIGHVLGLVGFVLTLGAVLIVVSIPIVLITGAIAKAKETDE